MVSGRPVVAVVGAGDLDLPGLEAAEALARVIRVDDPAALPTSLGEVDAVFAWSSGRRSLLDAVPRAPRLRWIQSSSAGVEDLADPVLVERGIVLTNAGGVFDMGLAESVLGFLLAFSARILESARAEQGAWPTDPVRRLRGTVALVVGAGSIGTETGRLLRSVGLRARAVARTARSADDVFESIVDADALHAESAMADHVVNVLPITPATRGMFGAAEFAAMKPTAVFVNIGRGDTVNEPALIEALRGDVIAGAALDVFQHEPLPAESPLWRMPNVLVSPHRAGDHVGWEADVVGLFLENLQRFVSGASLRNVVDVGIGYAPGGRS